MVEEVMSDKAMSWLWKGTKAMFYLVSPQDLALGPEDPAPMYFLDYGLPMFFVMILMEWVIMLIRDNLLASSTKTSTNGGDKDKSSSWPLAGYRLNDAIASITLGSYQLVGLLMVELAGIGVERHSYTFVYENLRLFTVDSKANVMFSYVCLFLGKDLAYYWAHRMMHEWHAMWIGHSVHHSGEDYNLAMALRQGFFQPLVGWPFYLPLALLGFHPNAFAAHSQLNLLFMFWFHTDLIGRLPLGLEYVFNSPASHRMHHRPPGNCNYAGVLIVWDRLFGTYTPELVRRDLFGLAESPKTFDPAKLNTNHLRRMGQNVNNSSSSSSSSNGSRENKKQGQGRDAQDQDQDEDQGWLLAIVWRAVRQAGFKRRVPARWVADPTLLFKAIPPEKADLRRQPPTESSASAAAAPGADGTVGDGASGGAKTSGGKGSTKSSKATAKVNSLVGGVGGGGGRPKWDGQSALGFWWGLAASCIGLLLLVAAVGFMLTHQSLHTGDALLIGALVLASQSALGKGLDQGAGFVGAGVAVGGSGEEDALGDSGSRTKAKRAATELAMLLPTLAALFALRPVERAATSAFQLSS